MKNKIKRSLKKYLKILVKSIFRVIKLVALKNKFSRSVRRYAKMDAKRAIGIFARKLRFQIKIRPRIKLVSRVTFGLIIAFLVSSLISGYIKAKEADIKINGHAVLVANKADNVKTSEDETQIEASVKSKRSPFDFKYPVDGEVSQGYSIFHRAYDIAAPFDSPIKPLGAGRVEFAGRVTDGKGNIVVVDHGDGLKTLYAHMNRIVVGVGNQVTPDTVIGTIGLTGHTTGPHVHLEVYDGGVAINPGDVLPDK